MEINRRKVYPAAHSSRSTYPQCVGGSGLETALIAHRSEDRSTKKEKFMCSAKTSYYPTTLILSYSTT